ncbi:MAG: 50S ribosomal protein L7ae [Clostridia bacterium]|nr:50S ribosomal protein L7ae [Clostridia bacterium]MBQ7014562.1 50S ribosomal protein L7ae [Clostridia bacterium]
MANNKFISLISLARKAGKLVLGYDKIKSSGKKFKLIIICSDVSERTIRNAKLYISEDGSAIDLQMSMFEFGKLIGAEKVGVAAVDDDGFAKAIFESMK